MTLSTKDAARITLAAAALVEGAAALTRHRERASAFEAAVERATALSRRLVVIGDPDAGMNTRIVRAYGCGDVCLDKNGCPACPVTITADLTKGPIEGIADDTAVIFVSCVLEYVEDLDAALREIARMAGSGDNVFIVGVQPWTITSRLYPGARWRGTVIARGDEYAVDMKPVRSGEKLAFAAALGLTLASAFWPDKPNKGTNKP
jgi:hypothetical protein